MVILMDNFQKQEILKSSGEIGTFSKTHWIKEAESKYTSAILLRNIGYNEHEKYEQAIHAKLKRHQKELVIFQHLDTISSVKKSSILLIGYALELLLKSCMVSLLINSPKEILEITLKKYSHNLVKIANELQLNLTKQQKYILEKLGSYITLETRYPITASSIDEYSKKQHEINDIILNDGMFSEIDVLYQEIKLITSQIDGQPDNMKFHDRLEMGLDGFITYRCGGPIPPTFIIKYSSEQIEKQSDNINEIKRLIQLKNKDNKSIFSMLMEKHWDDSVFYKIHAKNGLTKT